MLIMALTLVCFFPAVIFLDYHKRHNIYKGFGFLMIFAAGMFVLSVCIKIMGLSIVNYLLLIPATIFGVLFTKNGPNKK